MKKIQLNPLALDKETIAKLDEKQLQEILGGAIADYASTSTGCDGGSSDCGSSGQSGGCTSGSSKC